MALVTGIKGIKEITVTEDRTAESMGSGLLPVYATPWMIALMEHTAFESIQDQMEDGKGTVGVAVDIKHIAATPVGRTVRCESELIEIDGKKLKFSVNVYDGEKLIGTGIHKRAIIDNEAFMANLS
ncbi:MAG: thioesterase family protein [Clostridiales bacterium]|nr:thioesterase family protein [Clostridiales bacterium]